MPTDQEVAKWIEEVDAAARLIGPRFSRRDLRCHAECYLRGLISRIERKNGWQLAEELGQRTPTNLQHFVARSRWSADEVRDDLRQYVVNHLGSKDGVLIVDETGFLKKGEKSVGVKRQYSGTAGRIENCQIGVFLAYRSDAGHALIDRSLYLPKEWAADAARRAEAKVPESVTFATKPALARAMLKRTLDAGVPAKWVTADEVYGSDSKFRRFCEGRGLGYVVAISSNTHLFLRGRRTRVDEHVRQMPKRVWRQLSCGPGLTVLTDRDLKSVTKSGPRITSLVTKDGTFTAKVYVDGTYEGDLMAAAGIDWTIGREGRAEYGEPLAGKQYPKQKMKINGFDDEGKLLPLVTTSDAGPEESGDRNVMTYSFRLCLTTDPDNRVPMPKPANYDPARFEIVRRALKAGENRVGFDLYPLPGGKLDGNNSIGGQFSLGLVGGGNDWHTADEAGRKRIWGSTQTVHA